MTVISIANYAAKLAVQIVATRVASTLITETTHMDSDSLAVRVASGTIGWQVGEHTEQYTESAVEHAAVWLREKHTQLTTK